MHDRLREDKQQDNASFADGVWDHYLRNRTPKPEWSMTQPTEPGWYWRRDRLESRFLDFGWDKPYLSYWGRPVQRVCQWWPIAIPEPPSETP